MKIKATLTPIDVIDLERIVRTMRKTNVELARIPKHSGGVSSEVRKKHRQKRRELKEKIEGLREEIIQWAQARFPLTDEMIEEMYGYSKEDSGEEDSNDESTEQGVDVSDAGRYHVEDALPESP